MTTFLYTNIALLDIATKEQSTSYKIQQCTKGTKYFEERLGLAFKKVDGECLSSIHRHLFVMSHNAPPWDHYMTSQKTAEKETTTTGLENCIFVI